MFNLSQIFFKFITLILGLDCNNSFPPPLNKDEEKEMFKRLREGDASARDIIIERNLRLVSHIVKKY